MMDDKINDVEIEESPFLNKIESALRPKLAIVAFISRSLARWLSHDSLAQKKYSGLTKSAIKQQTKLALYY